MAALRSSNDKCRVGCVIFSHDHSVQSIGWNGRESGAPDSGDERWKVKHAEFNALYRLDNAQRVRGGILYTTHFPCSACAHSISLV